MIYLLLLWPGFCLCCWYQKDWWEHLARQNINCLSELPLVVLTAVIIFDSFWINDIFILPIINYYSISLLHVRSTSSHCTPSSKQKKKHRWSSRATLRKLKTENNLLKVIENRIERSSHRLQESLWNLRQSSINFKSTKAESLSSNSLLSSVKDQLRIALRNHNYAKHMHSHCM